MKSPNSPEFAPTLVNGLMPVDAVIQMIHGGASLALAGTEAALDRLPAGTWIGGTTPYFMTEEGGTIIGDDRLFVTDLSSIGTVTVHSYGPDALAGISGEAPDRGFVLAVLPAESECHQRFAIEAPEYPYTFLHPTVGWIAGYDLAKGGSAKVYDGSGPFKHDNRAVAAQVEWHDDSMLMLEIVNPFVPGNGTAFQFEQPGLVQVFATVDGQRIRFADYLIEHGFDRGDVPLVGDYAGARINVSIRSVNPDTGEVTLYAPAFPGVTYRFAEPLADYAETFRESLAHRSGADAVWSCNCILNFLFGGLEGKAIGGLAGPVTFGEIAYQLLNQTLVLARRA